MVTTFSTNTQVHVTGKTANDWFRVEQSEGDVYISGKLLGMEKAVTISMPVDSSELSSSGLFSTSDVLSSFSVLSTLADICKLTEKGYLLSDGTEEHIKADRIPEVEGITPIGEATFSFR